MKKSNNNGKVIQSGLANEGRNREGGPGAFMERSTFQFRKVLLKQSVNSL